MTEAKRSRHFFISLNKSLFFERIQYYFYVILNASACHFADGMSVFSVKRIALKIQIVKRLTIAQYHASTLDVTQSFVDHVKVLVKVDHGADIP